MPCASVHTYIYIYIYIYIFVDPGLEYNDDGDIIISEDEFIEIQKLKELKLAYHTNYGQLRNVKTQVLYCQNLVDQCRQRLLNGE